jgi:D-alanyl-D-alanine endopeptidase (penicillin-binding protein 7)
MVAVEAGVHRPGVDDGAKAARQLGTGRFAGFALKSVLKRLSVETISRTDAQIEVGMDTQKAAKLPKPRWRQLLLTLLLAGFAVGASTGVSAASTPAVGVQKASATVSKKTTKRSTVTRKSSSQRRKASTRKRVVKRQRSSMRRVIAHPITPSIGRMLGLHETRDPLNLQSSVAFIVDQRSHEVLLSKNRDAVLPIASITKLMTALVVLEAQQPMDEPLEISVADIDTERHSHSRLAVGLQFSRADLLRLALMSSENRAASALGRHYPGGFAAFVAAMNRRARELGMASSHYADATGLSSANVSTAADLARLVNTAYRHPLIREYSTQPDYSVASGRRVYHYVSSNRLVRAATSGWQIGLQKTGYINEAGHCLVMQATVQDRPVIMVFLDSVGKLTRFADAQRVRQWLEAEGPKLAATPPAPALETAAGGDSAM